MAKRNGPAESSSESSTSVEPTVAVTLSVDDWKNVLASMEVGIKAIGFSAFEIGGRIMREITDHLPQSKD